MEKGSILWRYEWRFTSYLQHSGEMLSKRPNHRLDPQTPLPHGLKVWVVAHSFQRNLCSEVKSQYVVIIKGQIIISARIFELRGRRLPICFNNWWLTRKPYSVQSEAVFITVGWKLGITNSFVRAKKTALNLSTEGLQGFQHLRVTQMCQIAEELMVKTHFSYMDAFIYCVHSVDTALCMLVKCLLSLCPPVV